MDDSVVLGWHTAPPQASGRAAPSDVASWAPAPAPLRRRPRRSTTLVALGVIAAVAVSGAGLWIARSTAYAERVPGPSVEEVVSAFTESILTHQGTWQDSVTPELATLFSESEPFTGGTAITVDLAPDGRVAYTDRGQDTADATIADVARTALTAAYDLEGDADVEVRVVVDLERELTRDADDTVTAASPWRISTLTATDAESTLTPDAVCGSSTAALTALSTAARVDGDLDVSCTGTDDPRSWLDDGADEQAWAAEFPVYGQFSPPENLAHFTRGIALTRVTIAGTPVVLVSIEATSTEGTTGWVLVGSVGYEG